MVYLDCMVRNIRGTGQRELVTLIDDYQALKTVREQGVGGYKDIKGLQQKKGPLGRALFVDLDSGENVEFNLRNWNIYARDIHPSCGYALVLGEARRDIFSGGETEETISSRSAVTFARKNNGWVFFVEREKIMPEKGKDTREARMRDLGLTEVNSVGMFNADSEEKVILTGGRNHKKPKTKKRPIRGSKGEYIVKKGRALMEDSAAQFGFNLIDQEEAQERMKASGFIPYDARRIADGGGTTWEDGTGRQVHIDLKGNDYEIGGPIPGSEVKNPPRTIEKLILTPKEKEVCFEELGKNFTGRSFLLDSGKKPIRRKDIIQVRKGLEGFGVGEGVSLPMFGVRGVVIEVLQPSKTYTTGAVMMKSKKVVYILDKLK